MGNCRKLWRSAFLKQCWNCDDSTPPLIELRTTSYFNYIEIPNIKCKTNLERYHPDVSETNVVNYSMFSPLWSSKHACKSLDSIFGLTCVEFSNKSDKALNHRSRHVSYWNVRVMWHLYSVDEDRYTVARRIKTIKIYYRNSYSIRIKFRPRNRPLEVTIRRSVDKFDSIGSIVDQQVPTYVE